VARERFGGAGRSMPPIAWTLRQPARSDVTSRPDRKYLTWSCRREKIRTVGVHMGSKMPGDRDVGGSGLNSHSSRARRPGFESSE
jgi:hypothetical protein